MGRQRAAIAQHSQFAEMLRTSITRPNNTDSAKPAVASATLATASVQANLACRWSPWSPL